ncbi:hypothetical protein LUZ60_002961 [Juncus effusus]|nr:hypothetical protein LUZ60_002961 [Juncus effusus]
MSKIPETLLNSATNKKPMPLIAMGTAAFPFTSSETTKCMILNAIKIGYRHFDTAALYQSEEPLGKAIKEAVESGLIGSRDELFITSKLWCSDAHFDRVVPALKESLRTLQLEYLDLYLVHWPMSAKTGKYEFPFPKEDFVPFNMECVWEKMEECQSLGLTNSIGVCNFSCKKLEKLLSFAKIPPAVNQVEVNPVWQQTKLREFCRKKRIQICGYSPLGAKGTPWGADSVMDSTVLKEIAISKQKTHAQICLRWVLEQGDCVIVKSFNEERMKENLEILDWELSEDDKYKISQIEQHRSLPGWQFLSEDGPYKSYEELWDGEV